MAAEPSTTERDEHCEECDQQTPHTVTLQIRTESTDPENAAYSREPYRVRTCCVCGQEQARRMNNA